MNTLSITLRHRPVRLGWCVEHGDTEAVRTAIRLSYALWGGRFCPIIPVEAPSAKALVKQFRVDALYGVTETPNVDTFIAAHEHLPWPFFTKSIFSKDQERHPVIADITHAVLHMHREHIRNNPNPSLSLDVVRWEKDDPLSDFLLATFGRFPDASLTPFDYEEHAITWLNGQRIDLPAGDPIPQPPPTGRLTIASLNRHLLRRHYSVQSAWRYAGFFIGNVESFDDLVAYWNLRAADIPLVFYDPKHHARLESIRQDWTRLAGNLNQDTHFKEGAVALWGDEELVASVRERFGQPIIQCRYDDALWNGLNVRAPFIYLKEVPALASIDEQRSPPQITFAVTDTYFDQSPARYGEHYVVSIDPGIGLFRDEHATFHLPFLPELNEFYGRDVCWTWNAARAEPDSLGIITSITTSSLTLKSVTASDLITEVLKVCGIRASTSKSGLIASNLIRQMGGLTECDVFKVRGVRRLIEEWRPDQSFSRSCAKQTIMGADTERPLSSYTDLYLSARGAELSPNLVLTRLLERGVFRVGLEFDCPNCQQRFWVSLDHAKTQAECDFCGHTFNCAPQLKDKDWAFRRSGLFGRNDNQEGALSVALALQHLRGLGTFDHAIFGTAMDLAPLQANVERCETDLVVLSQHSRRGIEVVIGECKTRQPIEEADVRKLANVSDALRVAGIPSFVVFAKLASFTDDEVELIRPLNDKPHQPRAILFTEKDLEASRPYKWAEAQFAFDKTIINFEGMAAASNAIYFDKKLRDPPKDQAAG